MGQWEHTTYQICNQRPSDAHSVQCSELLIDEQIVVLSYQLETVSLIELL